MGFFAAVDGRIGPAEEARVSVCDNGFVFGDGVYETLRTYGGRPFHLDRHLLRLRRSADRLGFAIRKSDASLAHTLDELLDRAGNDESFIRMIVSRGVGDVSYNFDRVVGPTVVMVARPYEALPDRYYSEGLPVVVASVQRNARAALDPAIKSCNLLNNVLAVREAQSKGGVEALMLNERGELAEGASSNVFVVRRGIVLTPPLDAGILAGITREVVLERSPALGLEMRETMLRPEDLYDADEAFLTSTLKEVAPIRTADGRTIGPGRPGSVTLRILADFREYARAQTAHA